MKKAGIGYVDKRSLGTGQGLLWALRAKPGSTSQELARARGVAVRTVRGHLRALRKRGCVRRETRWLTNYSYTWVYFRTGKMLVKG